MLRDWYVSTCISHNGRGGFPLIVFVAGRRQLDAPSEPTDPAHEKLHSRTADVVLSQPDQPTGLQGSSL